MAQVADEHFAVLLNQIVISMYTYTQPSLKLKYIRRRHKSSATVSRLMLGQWRDESIMGLEQRGGAFLHVIPAGWGLGIACGVIARPHILRHKLKTWLGHARTIRILRYHLLTYQRRWPFIPGPTATSTSHFLL